ncbi:hypothetical protein H257_14393 [Aphanomyces astaci]|uniref:Uncharacterized protein n=1 Tax=Aphanomyces astaci TaxID=112090 RepID=W4FSZ0_APHAT|nr:hypothetical protein H257_14393 [Aphanomyces astaci]ETV70046.1 hypothetical protein H257_14393 [Aphanomyces astaci]|eukprot:XP_009840489.1 hypothetical protein H257_14393 [Aphanomyces astaci]
MGGSAGEETSGRWQRGVATAAASSSSPCKTRASDRKLVVYGKPTCVSSCPAICDPSLPFPESLAGFGLALAYMCLCLDGREVATGVSGGMKAVAAAACPSWIRLHTATRSGLPPIKRPEVTTTPSYICCCHGRVNRAYTNANSSDVACFTTKSTVAAAIASSIVSRPLVTTRRIPSSQLSPTITCTGLHPSRSTTSTHFFGTGLELLLLVAL